MITRSRTSYQLMHFKDHQIEKINLQEFDEKHFTHLELEE